jgi:class 3 adenylate cyclase
MFTDIVGSTQLAAEKGDKAWKDLLQKHDDLCRNAFRRHGGDEIKSTGDGFLITFRGPTPAIRCAESMRMALSATGLSVRIAIHTGECNVRAHDVSGLAVHLASRLMDHAGAGDIVVSRTIKDLLVGSDMGFAEKGEVELKDIPGRWPIYAVRSGASAAAPSATEG